LRLRLRASCFWVEAAEGDAGAAIYCRKAEIELSLPHDQSVPLRRPRSSAAVPTVLARGQKGATKFTSAKIQRNPLKRLDSDERIQGNPSLSNPQNQGFCGCTARVQENPNRVDRTERRARRREGASRLHPNAERSSRRGAPSGCRTAARSGRSKASVCGRNCSNSETALMPC
jgi:hypothetical protein